MQKRKYVTLKWLDERWNSDGGAGGICDEARQHWFSLKLERIHIHKLILYLMEGKKQGDKHDWLRYLACIYFTDPIQIGWRDFQKKVSLSDKTFDDPKRLGKWFLRRLHKND